ncbi:MAG TPA: hypothetical protein VGD68_05805 [Streptosporangiaceae bacterium]
MAGSLTLPGRPAQPRPPHLQFIRPEDLDRFAGLGVVANFQPLWATHDPQMQELTPTSPC